MPYPYLAGESKEDPPESLLDCSDEQQVAALRYDNCKLLFKLRTDPYERANITSNTFYDWLVQRNYRSVPAQAYMGEFLATFQEYPPRQKADTINLDAVMKSLEESAGSP